MHCPFCNAEDTKVIDSRLAAEGAQVRRRRQCTACQERFITFEIIEAVMPVSSNPMVVSSRMMDKNCVAQCSYRYKTSNIDRQH